MVANFAAGGAAINQLAQRCRRRRCASSRSISNSPPRISPQQPAMDEAAVPRAPSRPDTTPCSPDADLVCLGEMGIGNTTAAAAIAAALFGGGGARWAGRGTGVDDEGLARKRAAIDAGARPACGRAGRSAARSRQRSAGASLPPSSAPRSPRGTRRIPVLLDGFVCTAAVAPLGEAPRRCARSCAGRACVGRSRAPAAARGARPASRCSISACGSAKARARRWRC